MKLKSLIMFSAAALAFAACSNDEDVMNGSSFDGPGAVSVKITTADLTRMAGAATADGAVNIDGTLTVTLKGKKTPTSATEDYVETIMIDAADVDQDTKLTFWNIATPTSLTVSINGGVKNYSEGEWSGSLADLQVPAASVPAYGETTTFTPTTQTGTPDMSKDNGDGTSVGEGTEQGATEADVNSVYQLYTATVKMAIPVARLEVSNIMHVTHAGPDAEPADVCMFTKLVASGAYMDKVASFGGQYQFAQNEASYTNGSAAVNYTYDGIHGYSDEEGEASPLKDAIADQSFLGGETLVGPYTYNFFVNGTNPIFKLYFSEAEGEGVIEPRYAMITSYTDEAGDPVTFEAGHIYRIKDATLYDKNILGDEEGNTLWGVEVTVVEATWEIVDIEADWAE